MASSWSALKQPLFKVYWIGYLIVSIGSWAGDMAVNWLMASSTNSSFMIASINVASSLPFFLFAFIAGILSDAFKRSTMLFINGLIISLVTIAMGYIVDDIAAASLPYVILIYVFIVGAANAFFDPVWRGTLPLLLSEDAQSSAFTLDGVATNLARATGPLIAGIIIAQYNVSYAFYISGLGYLIFSLIVLRWKTPDTPSINLTGKIFTTSIRTGFQFLLYSTPIQKIFFRGFLVMFPASAMWSMWPVIGKHKLELASTQYGLVVAFVGIGAIVAATFIKSLKTHLGIEKLFVICSLFLVTNMLTMAFTSNWIYLCLTMLLAGFSWVTLLSTIQANLLPVTPDWVKSRVIALYSLMFFGIISVGSFLWGLLAEYTTVEVTLCSAGALSVIFIVVGYLNPFPVLNTEDTITTLVDFKSSFANIFSVEIDGPIMISIDYRISEEQKQAFLDEIEELGNIRRKNGAYLWTILQDLENPLIQKEQFMVSSKEEYEQQKDRMTTADTEFYAKIVSMTVEQTEPSHRYFKTQEIM